MAIEAAFISANTYSAELTRRTVSSSVFQRGATIGSGVGGVVGVGDFAISAGGAMSINVATGEAGVPGSSSTSQGLYYFRNSASLNTAISPADPSNPRIDLVCLSVNDAQYVGALNSGVVAVVTGTPTTGATLANLTGAGALPVSSLLLGYVLVPAAAASIITADILNMPKYLYFGPNIWNARPAITTVAANSGDHIIAASGTFAATLPVPFPNARVRVTNYGTGVVTPTQNASEKIYGVGLGSSGKASFSLLQGGSATMESDGTSWYVVGGGASFAVPAVVQAGTSPTTSSTTYVMAGYNATFTPLATGNMMVIMAGSARTATGLTNVNVEGWYATSAYTAGHATSGTQFGATESAASGTINLYTGFGTVVARITGLTPGTTYYFDTAYATGNGSDAATLAGTSFAFWETP